ncbi:NACHT, LRR and PYD domains-containing protein 12 [Stegastes partitus]|uniref:NACHT, LRR and PYD domains-containing protein 12-like n=1 Tax=Stegastes partitus TaxID=144197 RepID=A0A3B4Z3G3_9TELE|nr:PREDICTED: NACHT, LRR and PYD domains-containing protein 12-like [Stegastes partitus]
MDKAAVLTHILKPRGVESLLGGELPVSVITSKKYIHPLTGEDQEALDNLLPLDRAIFTALSGEIKTVTLLGPAGSGKTTALEKLVIDWAKGEQLQNFSYVFHFRFRDLNSLEGALSLEALIQKHHVPPESVPLVLQKPEDVLLVFDGLNEYKYSLDPSVHTLCSDPTRTASVSCLVASLLHGSLLKGATFMVATRPTKCLGFLSSTKVEVFGFLKPQREAYFTSFFTDPAAASKALTHMEKTLGFYNFCTTPRFCWTVCSMYKSLIDSGAQLPETLTQLFVHILLHLLRTLSLNEACNRELVLALGKMASHCCLEPHSSCTKEQMDSFGFQRFLTSAGVFLRVDGDLESDTCVFSFHSQLMQEFILAVSVFLDRSTYEGLEKILERHKDDAKYLDFFLSGLSETIQRNPLETLLGQFNSDQIKDFKSWFKSSSKAALEGHNKEEIDRFLNLLHQAQNESLVRETISPSPRMGVSYSKLSLQNCVVLNYVATYIGEMSELYFYSTKHLTEEMAAVVAPAMSLSHLITLTQNSLSTGAVHHLASALSKGITGGLDLSYSNLGDEKLRLLCTGLRHCKVHTLHLPVCQLTKESCEDLASVLASDTAQLRYIDLRHNEIMDQGFAMLGKAMHSPHCKLQTLQIQKCGLTAPSMEVLSAALCSGQSQLKTLNLTHNVIGENGVEALCKALQHSLCKLKSVTLYDCELTGACCTHLKEALLSEHFALSELDLSVNELGQEGALLLCQGLGRPGCPIETLGLTRCELTLPVFKELGSLLKTSRIKSLSVGLNKVGDEGVKHLWDAVAHPNCLLEKLDVEMTDLTDACVEDLCAAIRASKTLKELELRNNEMTDAAVPALVEVMQDSDNMLEMNVKYNDFSEEVFDLMEQCSKISY